MSTIFEQAMQHIRKVEGGYVDDPADRGGATMEGITQRTYDRWRDRRGQSRRPVRESTADERDAVYLRDYWMDGGCAKLPDWLAICHFDACVNLGEPPRFKRSWQLLQTAVGAEPDGIPGPKTFQAARIAPDHGLYRYLWFRTVYYLRLATRDRSQEKFLRTWLWRLGKLRGAVKDL